jgi:hypothetical protein
MIERDLAGTHSSRITIPAMGSATTDDEFPVMVCGSALKIVGINILPTAAITHNATNYTTVSVRNRGGAAAGTALPFGRAYSATDAPAFENDGGNAVASATASDPLCNAGDIVTVQRVHSGTGLALPAMTVEVVYQYR